MRRWVRVACAFFGIMVGIYWSWYNLALIQHFIGIQLTPVQDIMAVAVTALVGGMVGFLLAPLAWLLGTRFSNWLEVFLRDTPFIDILIGAVGLIVGLVIANLVRSAFVNVPIPWLGRYLPTVSGLLFAYLGWTIGVRKRDDVVEWFEEHFSRREPSSPDLRRTTSEGPKILDTSVIIDGRIADVCETGFLEGPLIIPGFVLDELQSIADSSDSLKRKRGRRGLEILKALRQQDGLEVEVLEEHDFPGIEEVDRKLIKLATLLEGKVLTTDFTLNKVAQVQGVEVLNINDLANSLKPVVLPGESLEVEIVREGKESGQGVGYLDDGTMIVVERGRSLIGQEVSVMATSVLQTSAGKMIFAEPAGSDDASEASDNAVAQ